MDYGRSPDANWIWCGEDRNAWNQYAVFRREFDLDADPLRAVVEITAVTRYEVYINGILAGKGPIRGWPEDYFYDRIDVTSLLRAGRNCVAALVHHWGISTFQHIEMPAGLLAQLSIQYASGDLILPTDSSWLSSPHVGFLPEAPKIQCQMAFSEVYDARAFPEGWKDPGFEPSKQWARALVVESPLPDGAERKPSDIEPLSVNELYPSRLARLAHVRKPALTMSLETRPYLCPGYTGADVCGIAGVIAFVIHAPAAAEGAIHMPTDWDVFDARLNGSALAFKQQGLGRPAGVPDGVPPQWDRGLSAGARLKQGRNLLLVKMDGFYHSQTRQFVLDFPTPVEVTGPGDYRYPVVAGPFAFVASPWPPLHQERYEEIKDAASLKNAWEARSEDEFLDCGASINEVKPPYVSFRCAYGDVVFAQVEPLEVTAESARFLHANLSPTEVCNPPGMDIEFLVDFGRITCGYVEFECDASDGNSLDLYFFESYDPHSGVSQETFSNHTLRYFCRNGRQTFRSFVPRGGRFMRLVVRGDKPVRLHRLRILEMSAAVSERGQFHSSDYTANRIWEISRNTVRFCMEDTYVDCPTYEQTFWVGDSRNESLVNYYVYGDYELAKRCLLMVARSMERSGIPESQVPSGWRNVLPAWAELWMTACREYFEHTADERFLKRIQPEMMRAAEAFLRHINADGLFQIAAWNMLDWAGMDTPTFGIVTHQNALLVKALRDASAISRYAGMTSDADHLEEKAGSLSAAIQCHLWSENRGAFYDSLREDGRPSDVFSVQTQVAGYLSGSADKPAIDRLEEVILDPPADFVKIATPFMSFFYLEAMAKAGKTDVIVPYICENWGRRMLDLGATACWEVFDLTRSYCHAWSAAPGYFFGAYILGVRPAAPGFARAAIDPVTAGLSWAKGCVPTPHGDIYVSWQLKDNGEADIRVRAPKNIEIVSKGRLPVNN